MVAAVPLFQKVAPSSSFPTPEVPWQPRQLTTPPHCGFPLPWQLTFEHVLSTALYVALPALYVARKKRFLVPFVWLDPTIPVPPELTYPEWQFTQLVESVSVDVCLLWLFAFHAPAPPFA